MPAGLRFGVCALRAFSPAPRRSSGVSWYVVESEPLWRGVSDGRSPTCSPVIVPFGAASSILALEIQVQEPNASQRRVMRPGRSMSTPLAWRRPESR
jgi:hypothetical protein